MVCFQEPFKAANSHFVVDFSLSNEEKQKILNICSFFCACDKMTKLLHQTFNQEILYIVNNILKV